MFFAKLKDGIPNIYPITEKEMRKTLDQVSLPKLEFLTNDMLEPLGFIMVKEGRPEDFPQATKDYKVVIDSIYKSGNMWYRSYKLQEVLEPEKSNRLSNMWELVREKRDKLMNEFEWRISRYHRELDLGVTPQDNLQLLHQYMQDLADITNQPDPYLITYPTQP